MQARLVAVGELRSIDRDAMYTLLNTHFIGVDREVFEQDLSQKNWAILLQDETGTLRGFSTLLFYSPDFQTQPLNLVYSGDTIMDPSVWTSSVLPRAWIKAVNTLRQDYPNHPLYWLLISSGYRTYRFLPTFWQQFFPRYDTPTPPFYQSLMHHLAQQQFGAAYDRATGIVRFAKPQVLREHLRSIPPERLKDPHVQFFQTINPGFVDGAELVCLTELSEHNLTPAGRRMWFSTCDITPAVHIPA